MSTLAARIAAMRLATDISTTSAATNTTPLEVFVRLYNKARGSEQGGGSCYTNYMEGGKLLYKYLSPISIPSEEELPLHSIGIPEVYHGYEIGAIAQQVFYTTDEIREGMDTADYFAKVDRLRDLLVYYTAKHVLEDMT